MFNRNQPKNAKAMISLGPVNAEDRAALTVFCQKAAYDCYMTDLRST